MATTEPLKLQFSEKKNIIDWFVIIPLFVNIIIIYIGKYYNFSSKREIFSQFIANLVSIATMYILRANKECKSVKEEENDVGTNIFKVIIITIFTLLLTYPMMFRNFKFFFNDATPYTRSIIWSISYILFYMIINIIVNSRLFFTGALFCPHSSHDYGWTIYWILGVTSILFMGYLGIKELQIPLPANEGLVLDLPEYGP